VIERVLRAALRAALQEIGLVGLMTIVRDVIDGHPQRDIAEQVLRGELGAGRAVNAEIDAQEEDAKFGPTAPETPDAKKGG
jgi:hypothetical protein